MIRAVTVDHGHVGQRLSQVPANGVVLLNDFDICAKIRHLCGQVVGDASPTQKHNLPDR